jgi:hypothetical protein
VPTAIELPGTSLLSIQQGLETGWYNRRTQLFWFEQDFAKWQQIYQKIPTFRFLTSPIDHCGLVETFNLKAVAYRPIEWANLDFCSPLHAHRLKWLREQLAPCMAQGGHIAITTLRNYRKNSFIPRFIHNVYTCASRYTLRRLEEIVGLSRHCITDASLHTIMAVQMAMPYLDLKLDQHCEYGGAHGSRPAMFRFRIDKITNRSLVAAEDLANFAPLLAYPPKLKTKIRQYPKGVSAA